MAPLLECIWMSLLYIELYSEPNALASSYDGCFQPMAVSIEACTFLDNTALSGGLFGMCSTDYAISDSLFENNAAIAGAYKGGYGGAIDIEQVTVQNPAHQTCSGTGSHPSSNASERVFVHPPDRCTHPSAMTLQQS